MANNINPNDKNVYEIPIDRQLICTICNNPFNDQRHLPCSHTFCRQCISQWINENYPSCPLCKIPISILDFSEVAHTAYEKTEDLSVKNYEDEQITPCSHTIDDTMKKASSAVERHNLLEDITHQNAQHNQPSSPHIFESSKYVFSELILQNRQLKEQINYLMEWNQAQLNEYSKKIAELQYLQHEMAHLKEQNQVQLSEQLKKNEECQDEIIKLKKQNEVYLNEQSKKNEDLQHGITQLKKQNLIQLNENSKKNEELQHEITHLKEQITEHRTSISKLETEDKSQNTNILQLNQCHSLLETNVKSIIKYIRAPLRASLIDIPPNATWNKNGQTVGGQNLTLFGPYGLYVDDEQTIYVADFLNHRIVAWKSGKINGEIVAGGHGQGDGIHQLNRPTDVIVDKQKDSLIICDRGNKRIVRWPLQNGSSGKIIISNITCWGLTMDDNEFLYVTDTDKNEVRRYRMGESQGIVVAGGNGEGNRLDQFNNPRYIFVDRKHSVFVSDRNNHRVMKWIEGAKEGIVVAGGQGEGNSLTQLYNPNGVLVDQLDTVYVADCYNHRIVRWPKGAQQGNVIVGENGQGAQINQLTYLDGLSFDRQGNLYVVECWNKRVQRFNIQIP